MKHIASTVMALASAGEIAVGLLVLALPREVGGLLLGGTLDAGASLVARMLGCAVLALGVTWWMARQQAERIRGCRMGFFIYNFGIGGLFAWVALTAPYALVPWIVCVAHVSIGVAMAVLIARNPIGESQ